MHGKQAPVLQLLPQPAACKLPNVQLQFLIKIRVMALCLTCIPMHSTPLMQPRLYHPHAILVACVYPDAPRLNCASLPCPCILFRAVSHSLAAPAWFPDTQCH